jgi:hypothetical protein
VSQLAVKDGVQPRGLLDILCAATAVRVPGQPETVTITSCFDAKHGRHSRHYMLSALDFRSKDFPSLAVKEAWRDAMRVELGTGFDVILESVGTPNEHFHIEYDPK